MGAGVKPRILLHSDDSTAAEEIRAFLERAGHSVQRQTLDAVPDNLCTFDLVVLDGNHHGQEALRFCRRLRSRLADGFVPLLFILGDLSPSARLASLEAGADAYLVRPFAPGELLAQVQAFLRIHQMHVRLADKTAEVKLINQRLQQAYQQINHELEAARRIQMSFLPQALPSVPSVQLAVHYRPCGRVGGDFYDAFRLDEEHIGFYVADAMGHGVPASLLTIFLKRGVRAKEITGKTYRLVPPDEVLHRLNHDLIEQGLAENPFITMVYALLNFRTGVIRFSRAGHPHPLHLPREGEPALWEMPGSLLGVFATSFSVQERQLSPGDKLFLYTDGLETHGSNRSAGARLMECAARHRGIGLGACVDRVAEDILGEISQGDDFTVMGIEMLAADA